MPTISGGGSGGIPGVTVSGTPAASQALIATSSSAASWAYPPGFEIGYDQVTTASISITGTTEGTATTLVSCAAHTFDGGPVLCEVYCAILRPEAVVGNSTILALFEGATVIGRVINHRADTTANPNADLSMLGALRFTPSAASHTYTLAGWVVSTTGTPQLDSGAGGSGANSPSWVRFTKV